MKIVSFNIRCDYGQDGANNFEFRKDLIVNTIRREQPDMIGFQEVLPHVRTMLEESLPEYLFVGCGRGVHFDDESMTVALKKDTVELLMLDVFWLSDTPKKPGSRFEEQSNCPRMCTHALLHLKGDDRPFHLYNTHLDHISSKARQMGLGAVLKRIREDQADWACPAILMGDFNAEPGSDEIDLMDGMPEMVCVSQGLPGTFHDFGRLEEPMKIDYIYAMGMESEGCRLWTDREGEVFLSDHYPVEAVCRF